MVEVHRSTQQSALSILPKQALSTWHLALRDFCGLKSGPRPIVPTPQILGELFDALTRVLNVDAGEPYPPKKLFVYKRFCIVEAVGDGVFFGVKRLVESQ